MSLAEARERHLEVRKQLANRVDPLAERKAEKTALKMATEHTFEKVALAWLEHWKGNKSPRHVETTRNRLKVNVYPVLGDLPMDNIEPMKIVELAKGIESRGASDICTVAARM